jgi:hypothetical protein
MNGKRCVFAGWLLVLGIAEAARAQETDGGPVPVGCLSLRCRPALFDWPGSPWGPGEINRDQITTDRPDFTEASLTVGLGTTQLESGYTFAGDSANGLYVRDHSWGEALFRIGLLADWFEFRVGVFPASTTTIAGPVRSTRSGLEDLYLGAKLGLFAQSGWLPEVAIVPQMTVPTGASVYTFDRTLPGVNLLYGWDVTDDWTLGASTQLNRDVDDASELYTQWAQSITVGRGLGEKTACYFEWFAFFPDGAVTAPTEHYFNSGLTFLITDDIQWDIRGGVGLNDTSGDCFAGTGLSFRFR